MKILLIHPFGIGDVIFSLAAAEALARRGHTVDYLCNERTEELLALCPVVSRTHRFDRSALRGDLRGGRWIKVIGRYGTLRRELAAERYDATLDFSMGREYSFLAWCAGIRRRIGWDYKRRGRWLTDRITVTGFDDRSPRDYAMDLARLADPRVGERPSYPSLNLAGRGGNSSGSRIVIAPGGGESWGRDAHYKQWPQNSWTQLVQILIRDPRAEIVVVGSQAEAPLVSAVAAAAGGRAVTAVGEPFNRLLALLADARAFVGTDGGLLHLANLVGTPALGLYGPVSEKGYSPLDSAAPYRTLTAEVPCRPCYLNFRFTGCAYEKRCLTQITPERAAEELRALLAARPL